MTGRDSRGVVTVVGLGDDGPAGLGQRARAAIRRAELLAGGQRHLAFFTNHPADKLPITSNVETVARRLSAEADQRRCVVLASGDPCFFGIGPHLVDRLGRERVEIIPQVSSVALAFARLGLSWEDATVLSAHGRPLGDLLGRCGRASKLAILTDDENTPSTVAKALLESGMSDCPAIVLEHLGGKSERLVETSLAKLPGESFARLNILVVLPGSTSPNAPSGRAAHVLSHSPALACPTFGRPEAEFRHERGQVTKAEARAVALAKLRLLPNGVLWDVGAGSGSLSIEAAGLMPAGVIYAVERDASQLACLHANLQHHGASQVRPVAGQAPAVLGDLPRPDRVFVGGGGSDVAPIVVTCLRRLENGGRMVVNAATLESVIEAERCVEAAGWESELVQLSVSRGLPIGGRTRLQALNPVFILSAWSVRDATPPQQ